MKGTFNSKEPLAEEGYRVVGAAMEVYNHLGFGLLEPIYQEALEIELAACAIHFDAQRELDTFYKGSPLKKKYIPDLLVFERMVVELKEVKELLPEFEAQLLNYMRLTRSPVGYLLNFGRPSGLDWRRYILSEFLT